MSDKKQKDSKLLVIVMLLFITAGLYLIFGSKKNSIQKTTSSSYENTGRVNWDRLNEKMRILEGQKKIQQIQQEAQNAKLSRDLEFSDIRDRAEPAQSFHLDMLPETTSEEVYSDLDQERHLPESSKPRDVINAQRQLDQILSQLDKQRQEEFVKQFIENARLGGWQVKVSDELQVIEVRPIRQKGMRYPTRVPQSKPQDSKSSSSGVN